MRTADHSTARLVIGMSPLLAESQPLNMFGAWWRFQSQRKPTRGTEQVRVSARPRRFERTATLGKGRAPRVLLDYLCSMLAIRIRFEPIASLL
jgi:hypothetical protein